MSYGKVPTRHSGKEGVAEASKGRKYRLYSEDG